MRNGEIATAIMLLVSFAIVTLDKALNLIKVKMQDKEHTKIKNNEICALCGSQMENESGRTYCKQCGKRWGNFD